MATGRTQTKRGRTQATPQAPWRGQIRSTGGVMLWIVALVVVSGMYLAVNAKVARAGREVLSMEAQRAELHRINGELSVQLAQLSAPDLLLARAEAIGFRPAKPDELEYLALEGYTPEPDFVAPRPPASLESGSGLGGLSPAYTETLGAWLSRVLGRSDAP